MTAPDLSPDHVCEAVKGMSDGLRLYFVVIIMAQPQVGKTTVHTEQYCAWLSNEDEARGKWVVDAMDKNPCFSIIGAFVNDITDIAISGLAAITPSIRAKALEEAAPQSSTEIHQRRGMLADVILAALYEYDEWMKDDDYNALGCLERVVKQLERGREVARSLAGEQS